MNSYRIIQIYLILLISIFLSACGGPLENIANMILYPSATVNQKFTPTSPQTAFREEEILTPSGSHIIMWSNTQQKEDAPVVVYFHGNGENLTALEKVGFLNKLLELGINLYIFDYPSYGQSTGKPKQATLVEAGLAVFDIARNRHLQNELIIWGRSLGSGVALQVAKERIGSYQKLIIMSGWDKVKNLAKFKFKSIVSQIKPWLKANEYDSMIAAEKIIVPTLQIHGIDDDVIPFQFGENLAKHFNPELLTWKAIPGRKHNDIFQDAIVWSEIRKFAFIL